VRDTDELIGIAQAATAIGSTLTTSGGPHEVRAKGDRDSVTDVDVRIEREIRAYLRERTPEIGFLGEEEGSRTASAGGDCVWTLDPIDGTSNFVHGVPLCAVSLALVCEERPVVAAIDVPSMGLRYTAAHGAVPSATAPGYAQAELPNWPAPWCPSVTTQSANMPTRRTPAASA
jgi:myo-inositol-1(or 4)-monophosphatase